MLAPRRLATTRVGWRWGQRTFLRKRGADGERDKVLREDGAGGAAETRGQEGKMGGRG